MSRGRATTRTRLAAAVAVVAAVAAIPTGARAAFHIMMIREVFAGTGANPSAQYVMLQMWAGGQNQVGNHPVIIFDANGAEVGRFTFPGSVPNGANQDTILIATTQAQTLFGITPDLTMTAVIPRSGGKICFDTVDCVTWGGYTGPGPVGTPFNQPEGLIASSAAQRTIARGDPSILDGPDDSNNSAADFFFAEPRPRNNARAQGASTTGVMGFNPASYSVPESAGSVTLTVTRSVVTAADSVSYATFDQTAEAGSDYVAVSGTLSFAIGDGTESFTVPIISDGTQEGNETFGARLRDSQQAVLGVLNATVTISEPPGPPGPPRTLSATPGHGSITLAWMAPATNGGSPVTGYKVYGGNTSGSLTLIATLGNVLSFTETGLGNGVTRFYRVSAVNAVGEGPQSNEASATTLVVPSAPQSFALTPSAGQIRLDWTAPLRDGGSPVTGYKVYGGDSGSSLVLIGETPAGTTTFTEGGLGNGVTRHYRVTATNANGEGLSTPTLSATTPVPATPPSVPGGPAANPGPGAGRITISWSPPASNGGSPLLGYRIYAGDSATTTPLLTTVAPNVTTFTESGLGNNRTRFYRVSAFNAVGEGPQTPAASATTFDVPGSPLNLRANPGGGVGDIRLNWAPPASNGGLPVTGYVVYRRAGSGPEAAVAMVGATTVFIDRGLQPFQDYTYRLAAVNEAGEGARSNATCMKPFPWLAQLGCGLV